MHKDVIHAVLLGTKQYMKKTAKAGNKKPRSSQAVGI